jgi:four helix bundle protein
VSYKSNDTKKTIMDDYKICRKGLKNLTEANEYKTALQFAKKTIKAITPLLGTNCMADSWLDQCYRACISIPGNISEGIGSGTEGNQVRFYRVARGSAYETLTWLMLAPPELDNASELTRDCQQVISVLEAAMMALSEKRAEEYGGLIE